MSKITVIGSLVMDNVIRMERLPKDGETVMGNSFELCFGGKGANQCVAIARLGGDVEMVGMLGKDENGEKFKRLLVEEGIKSDNVFTSDDEPTAITQIHIDKNGQNTICLLPAANYAFGQAEIEKIDNVLKNTEFVVLQLEMRLDTVEEIIRRAKKYGAKVLLNPAPATRLKEEIFASVDYLTPNETELSVLTGMPTETDEEIAAAAKKLIDCGVKTVISTLGSRGAMLATEKGVEIIEGYKVKAIDTVAAGDSFNGAFVVATVEGKDLREAIKFANATGALSVQKRGAIASLPTRAEVDEFIKTNKCKK